MSKPKILALDIETLPLELMGWQLYDTSFGLNQIKSDWTVMAWSAMWVGEKDVMYADVSKQKDMRDDSKVLRQIYNLINEADVLVTQNGISFDAKKLNARFIHHGFPPLGKKLHIDTKRLAKRQFGFTSNSLEYLCQVLKVKHKKMVHRQFPGFELWRQCLARNTAAWAEMKAYNIRDTVALVEVYRKLAPWGTGVDLGIFSESTDPVCPECGGKDLTRYGYAYKATGKFQRYRCGGCGGLVRGKQNLLSKEKRKALKAGA